MNSRVEKFLYNRGLVLPKVRFLVRNQIYLSLLGLILFVIFLPLSWVIGFSVGALVVSFNFYFLAKLSQELVYIQKGALTSLLFSFYLRLILTGVILYAAIVFLGADIFALLIGLSIILLNIFIFGATLVSQKIKEA